MERLTLNKSWKLCLQMWKWITEQVKKGNVNDTGSLKWQWLEEHGFGRTHIVCDCFFCTYDCQQNGESCENCPAALVSKRFRCDNIAYDYHDKPIAFYKKLLELNKKRLSKK